MKGIDEAWLTAFMVAEHLPDSFRDTVVAIAEPIAAHILATRPREVGLCGTQASGKSTIAAVVAQMLRAEGLRVAVLSIDDLYLTREERQALAAKVHPLFVTRGPPGTHDVALGLATLNSLRKPGVTALPRFDKARDTRRDPSEWEQFEGPADVTILEGWFVGAMAQAAGALARPVNALERDEDPDGVWRGYANQQLNGPYRELFERLDRLILLQAPSFETVLAWRIEQEHKLKARLAREGVDASRTMNDDQIARFIAHYERITGQVLSELPPRTDLLFRLDAERRPLG